MPSPPIGIFLTTIASQPALRQRQEYLLRILQVKKIPFTSYDLASDEEAKRLWKRKAPPDKQQLPGILVGGTFPGTFQDLYVPPSFRIKHTPTPFIHISAYSLSEEAVEYGELDKFLRLSEKWNDNEDSLLSGPKLPPAKPVGVPGAMMPLQMTPEHLKKKILAQPPKSSLAGLAGSGGKKPIPVNKRVGEMDLGDELSGFGLQGVKVTENELLDFVKDLGLDDDAAGDLVKGLGGSGEGKATADQGKKIEEPKEELREEVKEQTKELKEETKANAP